jgi:hypothetical protein
MIKLNSLDSNGKPVIYRYDVAGDLWEYGSFSDIVVKDAAPPSKIFPTDDVAAGGIFDHVFITGSLGNGDHSIKLLELGSAYSIWTSLDDAVVDITAGLTVTYIYFAITEIEYVGFNQTNFKSYYHLGFDIYVAA